MTLSPLGRLLAPAIGMRSSVKAALMGAVGGLAGTLAMNYAQRSWTLAVAGEAPSSAAGKHDARDWQERAEHRNANEVAAQAVAGALLGRRLTADELAIAAPAVHFSFGAAMGAVYGVYAERVKRQRSGNGLGVLVWLAADEIAMPLIGLSRSTLQRPLEMHVQSLAAHLVYGTTTERVRQALSGRDGPPAIVGV